MKIFKDSAPSAPSKNTSKSSEGKSVSRKKGETPARKNFSANEIKEKLAAHVDTSDTAKNMAIRNSKKLGDGFMNEDFKAPPVIEPIKSDETEEVEEKSPNKKDYLVKSDIALNDPKDTNTQEKLKTVLSKGAFNFNPKERDALEKILGNQN